MTTKRKAILICSGTIFALVILGFLLPVTQHRDPIFPTQRTQLSLQAFITACNAYRVEYADWPQGDLAQITRTLCGTNPQKVIFLKLDRRFTNLRGEPTDEWGTTLRLSFADESAKAESAGKDKTFGTPDDMTLPSP